MAMLPPNILAAYGGLRQEQEKQFAAHKAYSAKLEKASAKVEDRKGDLDVAGRLLTLLNPATPKAAKDFLFRELSGHVGVDPNAEYAKGVSKVLTGLDPGSAQAARQFLSQNLEGATPGQITEMTKGILTGQVDMNTFVGQIQSQVMAQAGSGNETMTDASTGAPPQQDPNKPTIVKTQTIDPKSGQAIQQAQPFQPEQPGAVGSFEGQRTIPPDMQPANPQLIGALGYAPEGQAVPQLRTRDLLNAGVRIPLSPEEQQKAANEITERSVGINQTLADSAHITDIFSGRPEVLGTVGALTRGIQSTVRQVEGLGRLIYGNFQNEVDPYSPSVDGLASQATQRLMQLHKIDGTAIDSARIQSSVLGLAYRMAIARGIPGGRLTNAIIEQHLAQLGASGSPEQFAAVIQDTNTSILREFDDTMRRQYGISGYDVITRQMTDAQISKQAEHANQLPVDFAKSLLTEAETRQSGGQRQTIQPSSPTLEEERRTLGTLETQGKQRQQQKMQQDMSIQQSQEERAGRQEALANDREDRLVQSTQENQKLQREQFDFTKQRATVQDERDARNAELAAEREQRLIESSTETQKLQREKFEYDKEQDRIRKDKEQQDRIAKAFSIFASGFANAYSGAGGGSSGYNPGPGQDINAFRIAPPPQRTPPRPGGK